MTTKKLTKLIALYLPYILLGLVATNLGEAWRLAEGKELGDKIMAMMGTFPVAFVNPLPSLHAAQAILDVFSSFITDEISDFNSNVYYTNPDYLRCSYLEGKMLA